MYEQVCGVDLYGYVGEFLLDCLMFGDWFVELYVFVCIVVCFVECGVCDVECLCGDVDVVVFEV